MQKREKSMSKKKIFLIIGLFLLLLTSFRVGWLLYNQPENQPVADGGVIDLSDWDFSNDQTLMLDGKWGFIPDEFVGTNTFKQREKSGDVEQINVPGDWSESVHSSQSEETFGNGTYHLKVKLPKIKKQLLGIKADQIQTTATIYVNDQLLVKHGHATADTESVKGDFGPFSETFYTDEDELSIIIHVANFDSPVSGGITESIHIGNESAITSQVQQPILFQLIVSIIFFLHAMYALAVYFTKKGKYEKEILFFAILLFLHGFTILIDDDIVLKLPVDFIVYQKILFLLFLGTLLSLVLFVKHLFNVQTRYFKWLILLFILSMILVTFSTVNAFSIIAIIVVIVYITSIAFLFYYGVKTAQEGSSNDLFILLFIASYTSNMIWGLAINFNLVSISFYPFDFLISIIAIALLLIRQHIHVSELNEIQTIELRKMDKARDEFLANTSHELRNPLHGMMNITQSVLEQEDDNISNDSKNNLQLLTNIGKRMSYTLNDLSTITQLKENQIKLSKSVVDIPSVTHLVIDMLEFMKEGKDIKLTSQFSNDFPNVYADENRLVQILFNLVHNAIKYTERGLIQIVGSIENGQALVDVKDTGIGIDNSKIEKIFNPYEQIRSNQSVESGIGIGLSVTKQLVELHDGQITFESNENGTTFSLRIPISSNEQLLGNNSIMNRAAPTLENAKRSITEPAIDESQPLATESKGSILIVDDDPVNVRVLEQLLTNEYNVLTSIDPLEVMKNIFLQNVDVIISDVMMPNMSGYELTQEIRTKYTMWELPIILITARNTTEDIRAAFQSGANDYLLKPVEAQELRIRVRSLMNLKYYIKESLKFEAAWLQAQIQPHFLFNTLNSIASLAEIDQEKMTDLFHALGDYLQRSFSIINLEPTIPIDHEIELANSYITIEKARFGDRLQMNHDIDEHIDIMIPPLSIQPIIENAITHGILQKMDGGIVTIRIKDYSTYTEVSVSDDGVGMSKEKIKELLDVNVSMNDGVGVKNINRRLIQLYNQGLKIESTLDVGTTVSFRIPNHQ